MNKITIRLFTLLISLILVGNVSAHTRLIYPTGGETFEAGETITIEWQILVPHQQENWDLHYSTDSGITWEEIQIDMPPTQLDYEWTVPSISTDQAKIRIIMDNVGTDYVGISNSFTIQATSVSVKLKGNSPETFTLYPNYPNPFNPITTISFILPQPEQTALIIYNILGQEIIRLVDGKYDAGNHQVTWDASNVSSGIYFYRLQAGDFVETRKMVLLK